MAKAYTANAFSLDSFALSTARLYTFTQPGHSLWSLGQSNPFNPVFLSAPGGGTGGNGQIAGGLIFFGGGVPIYANGGTKIVGGLGISGDNFVHGSRDCQEGPPSAGYEPVRRS